MAITSVLKYEGDNKTFIWQHPNRSFNMGSELIVNESQEAVFILNGEVLDTFGPGRHILETENLPLVKSVMKLSTGLRNAFTATLYFVNKTEQMAIKWGTNSKISYLDPVYDFPLEIGACGEMSLSVSNSVKLLIKLVGTEKMLTQETLVSDLRAFLMARAKSIIPQEIRNKGIGIFEIDMHLGELSDSIKSKLADDFFDYGINLNSFFITTVLKPDEDRNYIKFKDLYFRKNTDVMEAQLLQKLALIEEQTKAQATIMEAEAMAKKRQLEGYTYQEEKGFEVAKEVAGNEAVGQFGNIGVGLGMLTGVGGEIGKTVGGITGAAMQSVTESVIGKEDSSTKMKFCMNCGQMLSEEANFCPKCGTRREY